MSELAMTGYASEEFLSADGPAAAASAGVGPDMSATGAATSEYMEMPQDLSATGAASYEYIGANPYFTG